MPLITGEAIAGLVAAHAEARARAPRSRRWSSTTRRATAASSAAPTAASSASSRRRPRATRRPRSSPSARSTPACTCSTAARCSRRSAELGSDNAQGELYLPDVVPLLLAAGRPVQAHPLADPELALGVNDRVDLATSRALAQQRIHRAPPARRGDDRGPGEHADRGGRRDRRRHDDRAVDASCAAASRIGEGCAVGPLTTVIDSELADGVTVLHSYLDGATAADGATVGPFAYLRPSAVLRRGREGRDVRRDQELDRRRRAQGPAPLLHRRRRRRRGREHRRGHDHGELRRPRQAPDDDRGPRAGLRRHRLRRARDRRRRRLHRGGLGHHRGRAAGCARHRAPAPEQHRGLRRAQREG